MTDKPDVSFILDRLGGTADVPCGSCTACCRSTAIFLYPEVGDKPETYSTEEAFDRFTGQRRRMLTKRADGACVYLSLDGGCSIHKRRPSICRAYDCGDHWGMLPRPERRRLKREGRMNDVWKEGERQWKMRLIADGKKTA